MSDDSDLKETMTLDELSALLRPEIAALQEQVSIALLMEQLDPSPVERHFTKQSVSREAMRDELIRMRVVGVVEEVDSRVRSEAKRNG